MDTALLNIALVLFFVLVGGFFAGSEIALVSLRDSQVRGMADQGRRGAAVARLRADSNRFLSAVQIGVTLTGFFASGYGGATIAVELAPTLRGLGLSPALATTAALVLVTVLVAFASLVLGELVPKRLALQRSASWALVASPVLERIARLTTPVIWLLGVSTNAVGRLIGLRPEAGGSEVSEEELRDLVTTHESLGTAERAVLRDVFATAGLRLSAVMVPRTEVDFLHADTPVADAADHVVGRPHSRYPVVEATADDVVGFVHVRDVLAAARPSVDGGPGPVTVRELAREVVSLPGSKAVLSALGEMRRQGRQLAIVVDEYGGTDGIVTLEDLVEELVGEIEDEYDPPALTQEPAELGGLLHRDEVWERTGLRLPDGPFDTLAGYVMHELARVPRTGDRVDGLGHRFVVTAMDDRRVDRVRVEPLAHPDHPNGTGQAGGSSPS